MKNFITIAVLAFSMNAYSQFPSGDLSGDSPLFGQDAVLTANPSAQPDITCAGQSVQLFALTGGGTSNYTYNWTSDPPGFTSQSPNPIVKPSITTDYRVDVYDGLTTSTGHVTVVVKPLPTINLVPTNDPEVHVLSSTEIETCVFHSLNLDAGNPGSIYAWNNGANGQAITVETSGIGADRQQYEVTVTNPNTGCTSTASITVYFTFSDCVYGVEEKNSYAELKLYPNPSYDGCFKYELTKFKGDINLEIYTIQGILVKNEIISRYDQGLHSSTLDLRDQNAGIYVLKASSKEDVLFQKLVIR